MSFIIQGIFIFIGVSEKEGESMFKQYPDIVSIADVQQMLGIGKNKSYELVNQGLIKSIRVGKIHKIPKSNVIKYLQSQT